MAMMIPNKIFFVAVWSLSLLVDEIQGTCQLPVNFTYFQKSDGFYCQQPNKYLESQYGGSFSTDTGGVARETNDPNVRFIIKEVVDWSELITRWWGLPETTRKGDGPHTPSMFWEGREDVYWHADAQEDTISTSFKQTVDTYIDNCLKLLPTSMPNASTFDDSNSTAGSSPSNETGEITRLVTDNLVSHATAEGAAKATSSNQKLIG
jgi:hypothetical protein